MNRLLKLELKKNHLTHFHLALAVIFLVMLGLLYLFAFIPYLDPGDPDVDVFHSLRSLLSLHSIVAMALFSILSGVMHAKLTVEEYGEKGAVLLFLYPLKREKIFNTKLFFTFLYTIVSMAVSSILIYGIFFVTALSFHINTDPLTPKVLESCILTVLCNSLTAGFLGIVALWIGFSRKSAISTVVASCILAALTSQAFALSLEGIPVKLALLPLLSVIVFFAVKRLHALVNNMEV